MCSRKTAGEPTYYICDVTLKRSIIRVAEQCLMCCSNPFLYLSLTCLILIYAPPECLFFVEI